VTGACRCGGCRDGVAIYWHLKRKAFSTWPPSDRGLTEREQFLIGLLPKAEPSRLSKILDAASRRDEREETRLRGVRWLVDIGEERLEVTA
jgi:hypothetical protein